MDLIAGLELRREAYDRPVHVHVIFVVIEPGALRVVHVKRFVTDHAAPRDVVAHQEGVIEGDKSLPRELAAGAEAADITAQDEVCSGRKLLTHAHAHQRIGPRDIARCGEGSVRAEREMSHVDRPPKLKLASAFCHHPRAPP